MQDDYIRSRGFALTLARRAVDDIRRDEFRQLRNYVDLCQALAQKTRFNGFFTQAQRVLQRADSLYYALIQSLLERVDAEHLCAFGVNLGVGGVVYGATRLKEEIERTGKPSAWINTANCAAIQLEEAMTQTVCMGFVCAGCAGSSKSRNPYKAAPLCGVPAGSCAGGDCGCTGGLV